VFPSADATAVQSIPFPAIAAGGVLGLRGSTDGDSPARRDFGEAPGHADRSHSPAAKDDLGAFLVGPENRLVETVVDAARTFARGGAPAAWVNPLLIVGPPGSGKSHLAQGLASIVAASRNAGNVLVTTAADFGAQYSAASAEDSLEDLRTRIRGCRLWVIEDLGRLPERKSVQAELVHTLDALIHSGAWVIATSRRAPGQLGNLLPAVRSRMEGGLVLPLASPGPAVRREFLRRAAAANGLSLEPHQIDELSRRLPATARQLMGAIQRTKLARLVEREAESNGHSSRQAASKEPSPPKLHSEDVMAVTARYFGLSQTALKSASRKRSIVHARSVAMYLARELADATLQEIGHAYGGRDHSTVLHACRKINEAASRDVALQEELTDLRRLLLAT
jgi:chromosomal replication initiator protein